MAQEAAKHELQYLEKQEIRSVSLQGGPEKIQEVRAHQSHLPTSLSGRGPYLSIRRPKGSVAALSRKEPMVKPRLSISSCSTQLGQASLDSANTEWFASTVSLTATSQRCGGGKKLLTAAGEQTQHIIHVFRQIIWKCFPSQLRFVDAL